MRNRKNYTEPTRPKFGRTGDDRRLRESCSAEGGRESDSNSRARHCMYGHMGAMRCACAPLLSPVYVRTHSRDDYGTHIFAHACGRLKHASIRVRVASIACVHSQVSARSIEGECIDVCMIHCCDCLDRKPDWRTRPADHRRKAPPRRAMCARLPFHNKASVARDAHN